MRRHRLGERGGGGRGAGGDATPGDDAGARDVRGDGGRSDGEHDGCGARSVVIDLHFFQGLLVPLLNDVAVVRAPEHGGVPEV